MLKITVFFLFNNRECFDGKSDQIKAVKSVVPNVGNGFNVLLT